MSVERDSTNSSVHSINLLSSKFVFTVSFQIVMKFKKWWWKLLGFFFFQNLFFKIARFVGTCTASHSMKPEFVFKVKLSYHKIPSTFTKILGSVLNRSESSDKLFQSRGIHRALLWHCHTFGAIIISHIYRNIRHPQTEKHEDAKLNKRRRSSTLSLLNRVSEMSSVCVDFSLRYFFVFCRWVGNCCFNAK